MSGPQRRRRLRVAHVEDLVCHAWLDVNEIPGFVDSRVPVARSHPHATSAVYPPASPARRILQRLFEARGPAEHLQERRLAAPLRPAGEKLWPKILFAWWVYLARCLTRWLNIL